jgi:hypothetical protein
MTTKPEENNGEPFYVPNALVGPVAYTGTIGTTTTPGPLHPTVDSLVAQSGLIFHYNSDLSNGNASRSANQYYGITDFAVFNDYIHYSNPPDSKGFSNTMSELGVTSSQANMKRFSVRSFLMAAAQRFEIYSLKFRNI